MKLSDIHIRDPFILTFENKYYMYGAPGKNAWDDQDGFLCYISNDLVEWCEPIKCFTAPEDFGQILIFGRPRYITIIINFICLPLSIVRMKQE